MNEYVKLATAAIIYRELQKEAFLSDIMSMIGDVNLPDIWDQIKSWASSRDDVSKYNTLPTVPPISPLTMGYNPFTRRTYNRGTN